MTSERFAVFGTTAVVDVDGDRRDLRVALAAIAPVLAAVDRAANRFRDGTDISRVNAGHGRPVGVSPTFLALLDVALAAAAATDGLVDPTVGDALLAAGYDRDFSLLDPPTGRERFGSRGGAGTSPRDPNQAATADLAGQTALVVDRERATVTIPDGRTLDLGATAKAWAADRAAHLAAGATDRGVAVNLGGDVSVAGPPPEGGWPIAVDTDHRTPPGEAAATILLFDGGLATSGTARRRWHHGGTDRHHIIDPRTGAPAVTPWLAVSVAAASCVDANTASTAAVVLGSAAPAWLLLHGLPARLVAHDRTLRVGSWPADSPHTGTAA